MRYCFVLFLIVSTLSCRNQPETDSPTAHLQQFLSRFCAFDHQFEAQNSISNAHSVVFFKQGRWQRSFIFKATKEGTHIVATLQELDFDKTEASGQTGRVHFEGLSLLLTEP